MVKKTSIIYIMKNIGRNVVEWYRGLPEKKKYVEFVTAVLSVPVMLTVIIVNLNNLNQQKINSQKQTQEKTTPIQVIITGEKGNSIQFEPSPTSSTQQTSLSPSPTNKACIKEVGQVSISSPRESEVIIKNPVCITIASQADYCPVEWSYKLNNDAWSEYSDKNICLYNLSNGNHTIQVKVKSTQSSDETTLQRSFVYQGASSPTAQPTIATSSAGM